MLTQKKYLFFMSRLEKISKKMRPLEKKVLEFREKKKREISRGFFERPS